MQDDPTPRARPQRPAYRPVRSPLVSMGPSLEEERRRHRLARIVAFASVGVVVLAVLLVWIVGLLGREVVSDADAGRTGAAAAVEKTGAPAPQKLAQTVDETGSTSLVLQLPIRRQAVTGIGFDTRRDPDALELEPAGTRANTSWVRRITQRFLATGPVGDLTWYQLGAGALTLIVVGALEGTEVYAPISGNVVAITDYELDGEARGKVLQLQPVGDGQTIVVLRNIDVDTDLRVGTSVSESTTRLGTVRDMEGAVEAPLARYTHDSGSGVELFVLRSGTS